MVQLTSQPKKGWGLLGRVGDLKGTARYQGTGASKSKLWCLWTKGLGHRGHERARRTRRWGTGGGGIGSVRGNDLEQRRDNEICL